MGGGGVETRAGVPKLHADQQFLLGMRTSISANHRQLTFHCCRVPAYSAPCHSPMREIPLRQPTIRRQQDPFLPHPPVPTNRNGRLPAHGCENVGN